MGRINTSELDWTEIDDGDMHVHRKQLGEAAGGAELGCSLYRLPAGESSWPYHYHTGNEEAIYVLAGHGKIRLEDGLHPLTPEEYVALPADASGGHTVINDSSEPLRYLAISTMHEPDVTVYPDSEKFGVFVGDPPGGSGERSLQGYYPMDAEVDYWDGE